MRFRTGERPEKQEMKTLLEQLIHDWESEVVEFKQAGKDYPTSNKIGNLLTKMRRNGLIINRASRTAPEWCLAERMQKETGELQKECRKKPGNGA